MTARILRGNALALPLADDSVDLVVTSPPYFGLRSYRDAGEHYDGQIGAEATPAEFVDALIAATREMVRVLKPSGSIWVNLGDKYAQARGQFGSGNVASGMVGVGRVGVETGHGIEYGTIRPKSLIGVPWRYALRCIDDLGLILRAEVIWSKPNGLPESVTDRVRRSHETWFHFTLNPRYYSAVDEIREAHAELRLSKTGKSGNGSPGSLSKAHTGRPDQAFNPLGKLPGSVWSIPTQPLKVPAELGIDHFAAFPMEWPRRIIQGWSPAGVCVECGEGRRPVVEMDRPERQTQRVADLAKSQRTRASVDESTGSSSTTNGVSAAALNRRIAGYACACPEPTADTTPGVVLDPFGGTGTTALVAKALGRDGISVDMSADYCRLAEWRTNDPAQIARAMQVKPAKAKKPAKQVEPAKQVDLFEDGLSA